MVSDAELPWLCLKGQRQLQTMDNQALPKKNLLDRVSRAKSAAHVAGVHGPKNAFDTVFVLT